LGKTRETDLSNGVKIFGEIRAQTLQNRFQSFGALENLTKPQGCEQTGTKIISFSENSHFNLSECFWHSKCASIIFLLKKSNKEWLRIPPLSSLKINSICL